MPAADIRAHVLDLIAKSEADRQHYKRQGDGILAAACNIEIASYRKVLKLFEEK